MKIISRLAVMFYVVFVLILGVFLGLFALHGFPWLLDVSYPTLERFLMIIYFDFQARVIIGVAAIVLLFVNYVFMRTISVNSKREKTIAFDNPAGRVSVSLGALEDLTRRVIARVPEVKEVRSTITAGKKGLEVSTRLVLNTEVNIPEMTAKLQDVVKRKVQGTIGLEENVRVRVHVIKIIPEVISKKRKEIEPKDTGIEPAVPFQGYRA
ncbi:MAG: alkaline shock response membrane anchor protein AmaP [Candidatus Omnitrophica bacterium]|nr:alkaline shock response membrane anchor protein AmaP [Candidatus Omnitrophota bacterium]